MAGGLSGQTAQSASRRPVKSDRRRCRDDRRKTGRAGDRRQYDRDLHERQRRFSPGDQQRTAARRQRNPLRRGHARTDDRLAAGADLRRKGLGTADQQLRLLSDALPTDRNAAARGIRTGRGEHRRRTARHRKVRRRTSALLVFQDTGPEERRPAGAARCGRATGN